MTTQLRTTPASAPPPVKVSRRATNVAADQIADQFAAMFASICQAPQPPSAKPPEAPPADTMATEIAAFGGTPALPTPVSTLQTPAFGTATETPVTVPKTLGDVSLPPVNTETAPLPLLPLQVPVPSSQRQESAAPSPSAQLTETISPARMTTFPMAAFGPIANTRPSDPIQPPTAPPTSRLAVEAAAQDLQVIANTSLAEQTLQTEAARRDANLVAGYLAKTTRNERDDTAAAGVKTLLAGNGFDLHGDERERNSKLDSRLQLSALTGEVSFAGTVRDFQSAGSASSIQAQTISQIIAQAETLPGRQMRYLRLRLRPEELGQIDIQLSRDATGRISAHISAERETARGMLSRSLDQLRETLSRAGLIVDKLQISTEPGLFAGDRESDNAGSNPREWPSVVTNSLSGNETEAGGQPRAEDEKLLSLRA